MTTPRSRLRVIRANAQALQRSVDHLGGSDAEFTARFAAEQVLWDENANEIETDLQAIRTQLEQGEVKAEIDDDVETVRNAWAEAREGFKAFRANPGDQAARTATLAAIDERLHAMVLQIGMLTIPQRVAEFIAQERIGGVFHFHRAFENELPLKADRVKVLKYMSESPRGLYGMIDVEHGLIWAVARSGVRRWRGYVAAAVILAGGAYLAYRANDVAHALNMDRTFPAGSSLLATYLWVLIGVLLHIGIDVYKQVRSNDTETPAVLDELFLWGHVHEVQMLTTAFGVWAGTLILSGLENPISWWSALVTGYSLDSVLDAGIRRFDSTITKKTKDLTDDLGEAPAAT